jgi:phosphoribosyl 1,2-cyclic phosphodiesterase
LLSEKSDRSQKENEMRIRFWGVRGSLPAPQLPSEIKNKISLILERLSPQDMVSPESKNRFLEGLPPELLGTIGGNTPCVSVDFEDMGEVIVFDSGSGVREMGAVMEQQKPRPEHYHIFYSHFHWDHIQGLPFFNPAYDPSVAVDFYSPIKNLKTILDGQMAEPYFPVPLNSAAARKTFHHLTGKIKIFSLEISYKKMNHPGDSYAYLLNDGKRRFIYASDTELSAADFIKNEKNTVFFKDADVIVLDSQYTPEEAVIKNNWGHSAFDRAVDFAAAWGIKHLVLFHHDPTHDDKTLLDILHLARSYSKNRDEAMEISLAREGMELTLT